MRVRPAICCLAAPALLGLAGCAAPVPVEQAEQICLSEIRYDPGPRTRVAVGVGGGGGHLGGFGRVSWDVDADRLMGRSPAEAFDHCVRQRSGQSPTRPLTKQPGWLG